MNLRHEGIIDVFTNLGKRAFCVWFSGKNGEGEYKSWHSNGQLWKHAFFKNGEYDGAYKEWYEDGEMWEHSVWKDGKKVRDIK